MENQSKSRISRRHLLESAGVVAGAGVASQITPASAAPQSTTPFFQRNQDTTKLTFWGQFPELLDPFKAVMADFTAAHPEVEIEVEMTTNDQYKTKIQSALNVGSGPDLYMVPAQPEMSNYVNAGTLVDVTDSLDLSQVVDVAVDAVPSMARSGLRPAVATRSVSAITAICSRKLVSPKSQPPGKSSAR